MGSVKEFLDYLGVNIGLIFAGFIGSFVSVGSKTDIGLTGKLVAILSGGAIANYLTPMLLSVIDLNQSAEYGFAFLLGFSGLEGVKWIISAFKRKFEKEKV